MNIVLTGFMGTGKSVVARELAKILHWPVIDTDAEIEKETGKKITEIFSRYGEDYFRQIEQRVIRRLSRRDNQIIAVGGGAVIKRANRQNLRRHGLIINLTASPSTICRRLAKDRSRPLLNFPGRKEIIQKLLARREKYYRINNLRINTDRRSPRQIARAIIARLKRYEKDIS